MPMRVFNVGDVLAAADVNDQLVNVRYAVKGADTSRASTTTVTNDPDLTLPVDASKSYRVELTLIYTAVNATGDLKFMFTVPAGAVFTGYGLSVAIAGGFTFNSYQATGGLLTGTATAAGGGVIQQLLTVNGVLANGVTAGSLTFQWSQNTSNATATIAKQGSYMYLKRVS